MPADALETRKCTKCLIVKTLDDFSTRIKDAADGRFKKGEPTAVCKICMEADKIKKARKRQRKRAEASDDDDDDEDAASACAELSFADFVDELIDGGTEPSFQLKARVSTENAVSLAEGIEARANRMAELVGQHTYYRWTYVRKKPKTRTGSTEFLFSCAQSSSREDVQKMPRSGVKSRTTRRMDRFDCHGYLRVTVDPKSDQMIINIKHEEKHTPYLDIELPDRWKKYIEEHARNETSGQIWKYIVQEECHGKTVNELSVPFQAKAVHYYWNCVSQQEWKLSSDPLQSARKFIETNTEECHVALLDVHTAPGTKVIAFQVTDVMQAWAKNTQELAMDSTWGCPAVPQNDVTDWDDGWKAGKHRVTRKHEEEHEGQGTE